MKTIRPYLSILIVTVLFFFLTKPFIETHAQLEEVTSIQIRWSWLVCSFLCLIVYWSAYLYPFTTLLSRVTEKQIAFHKVFTLFHLSNITRYLPGRIWGVVRILSLSKQFGFSKTAVGGSLTLHVGIQTTLAGLISLSLFFSKQNRDTVYDLFNKVSGHAIFFTLAIIGGIIGILFLIPTVLTRSRRFLITLRETGKPLVQKPFGTQWLKISVGHILLWVCQGIAFYFFVQSLVPIHFSHAGILTAYYAFARVCGLLSFISPGGLGIRDGLLALLLINYMPGSQATLVSLICRIWGLSAEIILASIAFFLKTKILRKING